MKRGCDKRSGKSPWTERRPVWPKHGTCQGASCDTEMEEWVGGRICEVSSHGGDFGPELGSRESLEVFKPGCGDPMINVACGNFPLAGPWILSYYCEKGLLVAATE